MNSEMTHFPNRQDAGQKLAAVLEEYRGRCVIYALPRGGVVLGAEIAATLGVPLDLVIARKIGHPLNPEYAICAVTEDGSLICNEAERKTVDPAWLKRAVMSARKEAARRRMVYLSNRKHIPATDRVAIVVDDGIATGLTIQAAIRSIRKEKPQRLIVAVPVAPEDVLAVIRRETDEVTTLVDGREYLGAVGAHYDDFPQISDEEVVALLRGKTER